MTFVGDQYLQGGTYVDGGVRQNVPIVQTLGYAKENHVRQIDIIINKPRDPIIDTLYKPKGIIKNLQRLIELWETQVRNDNMDIAQLLNELKLAAFDHPQHPFLDDPYDGVELNFHFIPQRLYRKYMNELVFTPERKPCPL